MPETSLAFSSPGGRTRPHHERRHPLGFAGADDRARRLLDRESRSWLERLHGTEPMRGWAIAELHERLRREAAFHVRRRVGGLSGFPRSDIDDIATQAAGDALVVLLRKLDEYRGDSQFWTWARRFAQLEAPVSIRRRLGHDHAAIPRDPEQAELVADPGCSLQDRAEIGELLRGVSDCILTRLTTRQRTVLIAVAINGVPADTLAAELQSTPGAIYKSLHDARAKLRLEMPQPPH
ncbi:MAG: RNA polymerase sigma factor [Solirubrobacteraceae bacterium]